MEYKIAGYTVHFPHQAYGVQLSFMDKVLKTLSAQQNALLEAPTGSGKTLSLLCSTLAWQERLKQEGPSPAWDKIDPVGAREPHQGGPNKPTLAVSPAGMAAPHTAATPGVQLDSAQRQHKLQQRAEEFRELGLSDGEGEADALAGKVELQGPKQRKKVPKIYYATRTHSQIAQVVRELKRSAYRPKMAILASREHYCVNKTVMKKPNRDEECEKLMREEEGGCRFFRNVNKLIPMQTSHALVAHDIEDLCKVGRSHQACPYYASRTFATEAELVFCPYSYLLDPVIRKAMDVDISNAVLIFDEAHNLEDNARDAASAEIELGLLEEAVLACRRVEGMGGRVDLYPVLGQRLERVVAWVKDRANSTHLKPSGRDSFEGIWAGGQMMEELEQAGLGEEGIAALQELYRDVRAEEENDPAAQRGPGDPEGGAPRPSQKPAALKLGGLATGVISRLLTTLQLMHDAGAQHVPDYRIAMQRWMQNGPSIVQGRRGSYKVRNGEEGDQVHGWVVQLCFWCLNPAVAFWEVNQKARSVVLTSGTLAPLDSFASELGADFPVRLEAAHVVNMRRQVLATVLPAGPDGDLLQATYKYTNTPSFQDSIGQTLLQTCQLVPDGVLVFLPSYILLERLITRWQASGLWAQLNALKPVVSEPRGTGDAFDRVMEDFYAGVKQGRGGVFLAVCRGKVSEGLDFADANARAVIVVGIPYPNVKDTKVGLKKRYNDEGQRTRGLLSGDHWYSQQAFRALNQAVGRCLRHRNDYGAILLVDERFRQPRNQQHLSRWVKGALTIQPSFEQGAQSLHSFFERLKADPPGGLPPGPVQEANAEAEPGAAGNASGGTAVTKKGGDKNADKKAGDKAIASSQFASTSQPTLKALWRNPQGSIPQHPKRPERKPSTAANGTRPPPPAWKDSETALAMGWIKPRSPERPTVWPGEVHMTQHQGHGAAGVLGDFAATQVYQPVMSTPRDPNPHAANLAATQQNWPHQLPAAQGPDQKPDLALLATQAAAQPATIQLAGGAPGSKLAGEGDLGISENPAGACTLAQETQATLAQPLMSHLGWGPPPLSRGLSVQTDLQEPRGDAYGALAQTLHAAGVQRLSATRATGGEAATQPAAGLGASGAFTGDNQECWDGWSGAAEVRKGQVYQPPCPASTSTQQKQQCGLGRQPEMHGEAYVHPTHEGTTEGQPGVLGSMAGQPGKQGVKCGQFGVLGSAARQPGSAEVGGIRQPVIADRQPVIPHVVSQGALANPEALEAPKGSSRRMPQSWLEQSRNNQDIAHAIRTTVQTIAPYTAPQPGVKGTVQLMNDAAKTQLQTPATNERVKPLPRSCMSNESATQKQHEQDKAVQESRPASGPAQGGAALPLSKEIVTQWLMADLAAYSRFLGAQPEFEHKTEDLWRGAAYPAIWDCFELAREVATQTDCLRALPDQWSCSLPYGLQLVAQAHNGARLDSRAVLQGNVASCLSCLMELPLLQAIEAMMWHYAHVMEAQPESCQDPPSSSSHKGNLTNKSLQEQPPTANTTAPTASVRQQDAVRPALPTTALRDRSSIFTLHAAVDLANTSGVQLVAASVAVGAAVGQPAQKRPSGGPGRACQQRKVGLIEVPAPPPITKPIEEALQQRQPSNCAEAAQQQAALPQKRSSSPPSSMSDRHVKHCGGQPAMAAAAKPPQEQQDPNATAKASAPSTAEVPGPKHVQQNPAPTAKKHSPMVMPLQQYSKQHQAQGAGVIQIHSGPVSAAAQSAEQLPRPKAVRDQNSGVGAKPTGRDGEQTGHVQKRRLLSKNAAEAEARRLQAQKGRGAGATSLRDARAAAVIAGWDSDSDMEDL